MGCTALRDGSCAPRISNGTAVLRAALMVSARTLLLALLLSENKAADFTHTLMHSFGFTFQRVEFQITLLETCTAVLRAASMVSTTMLLALLLFGRDGCRVHSDAHAFIWFHLSTGRIPDHALGDVHWRPHISKLVALIQERRGIIGLWKRMRPTGMSGPGRVRLARVRPRDPSSTASSTRPASSTTLST